MQLNPYLMFEGECETAFRFYAECLHGTIEAMHPYGDSPACGEVPPEYHGKIMHARLVIGDQVLMASDVTPGQPYEGIKGCSVSLNVDSIAEAERIYNALADGGTVQMPLGETFWAARFGMFVDRFGVPWMVNCEKDK